MAEFPRDPPQQRDRTISLHGGTISRTAPHLLTEIQAQHVENMIITDIGARTRRLGSFALGGVVSDPASQPFNAPGGMGYYDDALFNQRLSAAWGSSVYTSNANGIWTQVASSTSLVSNMLHQFVRGRSVGALSLSVCACERPTDTSDGLNGRSQLVVYDIEADTATQVSLAPTCIESFQERLFYGERDTVGWSEVGILTAYSALTNSIQVEPGLGGQITAIIASRDETPNMWILKERAVVLFRPRWGSAGNILPDTVAGDELNLVSSSLRILNQNTGCIATKSAAWIPGQETADVLFLSEDGVRALERAQDDFQRGAGFPLSYEIPTFINRINFDFAHKSAAAFFDQAYHLAVPLDGSEDNTHILRFDVRTKAWTIHDIHARDLVPQVIGDSRLYFQNVFATMDTSQTDAVDFSDPSDPPHFQAYQLFRGNLDPSTSSSDALVPTLREDGRGFIFQDPLQTKRWDKLVLQMSTADTSRLTLKVRLDQGQFNTVTELVISGTQQTIVLGEDALPWEGSVEEKRRFSFSLRDLAPSREIQINVGGVTGASEIGRPTIYQTEIAGHLLSDEFANDA